MRDDWRSVTKAGKDRGARTRQHRIHRETGASAGFLERFARWKRRRLHRGYDNSMKLAEGIRWADDIAGLVGLDKTYYISQIMFDEFKSAIRGATVPEAHGAGGLEREKVGRGFYDYSGPAETEGLEV